MDRAKPFDIPKREVWEAYKRVSVRWAARESGGLKSLRRPNEGRCIQRCKFAGNSDPLRGIIASNSDPF